MYLNPGQLNSSGFTGWEAPPSLLSLVRRGSIGGLLLNPSNLYDAPQIRNLTNGLQHVAKSGGQPPLFIAINHEGGTNRFLHKGFVPLPSAMAMAASGREQELSELWQWASLEMASLGINQVLAPVLDLYQPEDPQNLANRSFGDSPERVARMGQIVVDSICSAGIVPTAKHLLGPNENTTMSLTTTRDHLEAVDFVPFKSAIGAGLPALIMSRNIVSAIDSSTPVYASSHALATLREDLAFEGLVMVEVTQASQGTVAVAAGVDQLIWPTVEGVNEYSFPRFPRDKADAALNRVLATKNLIHPLQKEVDYTRAEYLAQSIWQNAITGVGPLDQLPITDSTYLVTFDQQSNGPDPLAGALGPQLLQHIRLPKNPSEATIHDLWQKTSNFGLLVVLDGALFDRRQYDVTRRPLRQGPVCAIARTIPGDLRRLPPGVPGMTAFDPSPETANPLIRALRGEYPITGRWPIQLEVR